MRRYSFAPRAKADLADIHQHIFDQDPTTATLVGERIQETVKSICVFPQMGKETAHPGRWVFGGSGRSPFRIAYRFDDEQVVVLRVFRASRQGVEF